MPVVAVPAARKRARQQLTQCVLAVGAMAQSAELLNTLPAPGALTTAIYFPDHPTKQFPAGDIVSARGTHQLQPPAIGCGC